MELLKSLQCMTTSEVPPLHYRFQPGIRLVHKAMPCVASCWWAAAMQPEWLMMHHHAHPLGLPR